MVEGYTSPYQRLAQCKEAKRGEELNRGPMLAQGGPQLAQALTWQALRRALKMFVGERSHIHTFRPLGRNGN